MPFDICLNQERLVGQIRQERLRTEGRGHKDFKEGGKLGQGVGALKRGWAGTPLRTMMSNAKLSLKLSLVTTRESREYIES